MRPYRVLVVDQDHTKATEAARAISAGDTVAATARTLDDAIHLARTVDFSAFVVVLPLGEKTACQVLAEIRGAAPDSSVALLYPGTECPACDADVMAPKHRSVAPRVAALLRIRHNTSEFRRNLEECHAVRGQVAAAT